MTPPFSDPEQFPAEFSSGEKAILTAVKTWQEEANEKQEAHHQENRDRLAAMDREVKSVAATQKLAYPEGDADGHRRYHEALIREAEKRARFWEKLFTSLAEKGLWALLILLGIALWQFIKAKVIP